MDEAFPGRPLHSTDPATKAKDKMLVELFNRVVMPQMKIWFGWKRGQGEEDRAAHWAECMQNLVRFETELGQRQTAFFGGQDFPGWLDYMIWPWMERINIYPLVFKVIIHLLYRQMLKVYFTGRNPAYLSICEVPSPQHLDEQDEGGPCSGGVFLG